MIEKLDPIKHTDNLYDKNGFITNVACGGVVISKINELIDVVKKQQQQLNNHMCRLAVLEHQDEPDGDDAIQEVIHADPYAEQKKWIGKLCRFWDDDNTNSSCGILTSIDTETFKEPQFVCNDEYDYEHCEPVRPEDDIIYKGE